MSEQKNRGHPFEMTTNYFISEKTNLEKLHVDLTVNRNRKYGFKISKFQM